MNSQVMHRITYNSLLDYSSGYRTPRQVFQNAKLLEGSISLVQIKRELEWEYTRQYQIEGSGIVIASCNWQGYRSFYARSGS